MFQSMRPSGRMPPCGSVFYIYDFWNLVKFFLHKKTRFEFGLKFLGFLGCDWRVLAWGRNPFFCVMGALEGKALFFIWLTLGG
jgi:hypothetical protein